MKIHFDLERSLRECDPKVYYSQLGIDGKPLFPNIRCSKRAVLNRSKVTFRVEDQIREQDAGEDRIIAVESSYLNAGILYSKPPQAVIRDPNDPKRFLGVIGFARNAAQENLGWESAIYDIIEYDSPLALEILKLNSNEDEDHVPAFQNTKTTIIKSVVNAIDKKYILDNDDAILEYLQVIAKKRKEWHKNILNTIRKEHISRWPTMKAYSNARAKEEAKRMNLPFEGDENKKTASLGYVRKFSAKKNVFWDGMTLSAENGWENVYVSTWAPEANPKNLSIKRKQIRNEFGDMEEMFNEWISYYLDMDIEDVRKKSKGRFPLVFNGFLSQDKEPQADKEGIPKEVDLVDENGKEWKRLDVSTL